MKLPIRFVLRLVLAVVIVAAGLFAPQRLAWAAPAPRVSQLFDLTPGESISLPFPSTHVVVRWEGDHSAVIGVSGAANDGKWQPWQEATEAAEAAEAAEAQESEAAEAAEAQESEAAEAAEAQESEAAETAEAQESEAAGTVHESGLLVFSDITSVQAQVVSGQVARLWIAAIDVENGPRRLEVVNKGAKPAAALAGQAPQPPVIRRSQWGADEAIRRGTPEFAPISKLIVHHTVTTNADPNPAATVRAIYAWHVQGNGWNDIGYNFLVDQNGAIYEGRFARPYAPGEVPTAEDLAGNGVIGAHAVGSNTGSIGIALLGTFNGAQPTTAQQNALTRLLGWEVDRHNLNPLAQGVIIGHRDAVGTECPGNGAYDLLPKWRTAANTIKTVSSAPGNTPGYWVSAANGAVITYGTAANLGSMAGTRLNAPVISMARTPSAKGYWLLGADGGIFSFGDSQFYGSTGGMRLNQPVVGLAPTPTGKGYWLVARDGGIFSFGDARFYGSTGAMKLNSPVVGMASTKSGQGYWLVAADGGIFSFGDAAFYGSTGDLKLISPIIAIGAAPSGTGYWLFARDGGAFAFNVPYLGSVVDLGFSRYPGAAQASVTSTGKGYYILNLDGGIDYFGDARFHGSALTPAPAAGITALPEP